MPSLLASGTYIVISFKHCTNIEQIYRLSELLAKCMFTLLYNAKYYLIQCCNL